MFEGLFQPMHLLVLLGIALLIFGPKKLPELGKGLGDGIRIFKASIRTDEEESGTSEHGMSTPVIEIAKLSDSK
jgi:sec-independent protein translocase protein TatA